MTTDLSAVSAGAASFWQWSIMGDGFGNPLGWQQPAVVTVNETATCTGTYVAVGELCNVSWTETLSTSGQGEVGFSFELGDHEDSNARVFVRGPFHPSQKVSSDACGYAAAATSDWPQVQTAGPGPSWKVLVAHEPFTVDFSREISGGGATFDSTPPGCPAVPDGYVWYGVLATDPPTCDRGHWDPLVEEAINRFNEARSDPGTPPETLGFYYQILNITCAAARSDRAECAHMAQYYDDSGWSEDWVFGVFEGYLGPNGDFTDPDSWRGEVAENVGPVFTALAEQCNDRSPLRFLAPFGAASAVARAACQRFAGDLGALGAGAPHFATQLDPWFKRVTQERLVGKSPGDAVVVACAIRAQHESLFAKAVAPGFDQVGAAGYMTKIGTTTAKQVVPAGAALFRDRNLIELLDAQYGEAVADVIYREYVATCGGNIVLDELPNVDVDVGDVVRFPIGAGTFAAGAVVDFIFSSEPIAAGKAKARDDGSLDVAVPVPDELPEGDHILHIQGVTPSGEAGEVRQPLTLRGKESDAAGTSGRPWIPIVGALVALGGAATGLELRRRKRARADTTIGV